MRYFFTVASVFYILHSTFYIAPLAQAALLPTPTGSCPSIAPDCVQGKCTVAGAVAPGYELPCNYTLDDILQSGVNFINLILGIVGGLALLMFVYGGYQMLTSMGNPEGIKKGKDTLTGAFIGLILILGVAIFVWFAGRLLGAAVEPSGKIVASPGCCLDKNSKQCTAASKVTCPNEVGIYYDKPCGEMESVCQ